MHQTHTRIFVLSKFHKTVMYIVSRNVMNLLFIVQE